MKRIKLKRVIRFLRKEKWVLKVIVQIILALIAIQVVSAFIEINVNQISIFI
jgi:hypothetical protein